MPRPLPAAALLLLVLHGPALRAQSPAPSDDPFATRGWHLELAAHVALETWNYNESREEMYGVIPGLAYGVGKGIVLVGRGPLYYVSQRGVDGFVLGATIGCRGPVFRRARWSVFWEADLGVSQADTTVPPRGTRFNYFAIGGAGATVRLRPGLHLVTGLRWIHLSNKRLAGRDRNPDIEAVGLQTGVLIAF